MDEIKLDGRKEDGGEKEQPVSMESPKVQKIEEYKEKEKKIKRLRILIGVAAAAGILIAGLAISAGVKYRTYHTYKVLESSQQEDTLTYSFIGVGEHIFRFGIDSAQLRDREDQVLWNDAYSMNNPQAVSCGDAVAVYDKDGTSIMIYDDGGRIGSVSTKLPIVKASVAAQGVVAAILENGEDTWIKYYSTDGEEIASFRTRIDSPGYPMDISLSTDGLMMGVAYAYAEAGQMKTQIAFYNFGSTGQNLVDNLVKAENYSDALCPEIKYADKDTCIAFFDDGFHVYEGTKNPKEIARVEEDQEIISCASNSSRIALILRGEDEENPYILRVYNLNGKEIFSEGFDFPYDTIQMDERQILLLNRRELCIYSLDGVEKFRGVIGESQINNVIGLGRGEYFAVAEGEVMILRMK
ncbi:MAG: DUF5711 family protein [Fusicatenibacter sp.]|nr:DUF5711 family protein [Fusicatenibacter sp.]